MGSNFAICFLFTKERDHENKNFENSDYECVCCNVRVCCNVGGGGALAAEQGIYANAKVVRVSAKDDVCRWALGSPPANFTCEYAKVGFGFGGGYKINELFSAEAGIVFASYAYSLTASGGGRQISETGDTDFRTIPIGGRISYPFSESFAVQGKAGFHFWKISGAPSKDALLPNAVSSSDGTSFYLGIGGDYAFTDKLSVQAEYDYLKLDKGNGSVISLGAEYQF